jgi:hypothetical protein
MSSLRTKELRCSSSTRRRGAQPGNQNARTHGFYAASSPHPLALELADMFSRVAAPMSTLGELRDTLLLANKLMDQGLVFMRSSRRDRRKAGSILFDRSLELFVAALRRKTRLLLPAQNLLSLAQDASRLASAKSTRNAEYPLFVPLDLGKSDANLSAGGIVLTDAQWRLISPLFDALQFELDSHRRYGRLKSLPDYRRLLRGILIKLGLGIRWVDLAALGFHPRNCRALYGRLRTTGRMAAIYGHLHRRLSSDGGNAVEGLVRQGCYTWAPCRVRLAPGQKWTWRKSTGLLLLQRAHHDRRRLCRERDCARRRSGVYLRIPWSKLTGRAVRGRVANIAATVEHPRDILAAAPQDPGHSTTTTPTSASPRSPGPIHVNRILDNQANSS